MTRPLPSFVTEARDHPPAELAAYGLSFVRGRIVRRKFDRGGARLRVYGPLHWYKRRGTIEVGHHVVLWPDVKLSVDGREHHAQLRIGDRTRLGDRTEIHCGQQVTIGSDCLIAWDVVILDRDYHRLEADVEQCRPVIIGDRVWIGCRSIVTKGVTVATGSVVAAGSVVTSDVPQGALVAGNPARVVREQVRWAP